MKQNEAFVSRIRRREVRCHIYLFTEGVKPDKEQKYLVVTEFSHTKWTLKNQNEDKSKRFSQNQMRVRRNNIDSQEFWRLHMCFYTKSQHRLQTTKFLEIPKRERQRQPCQWFRYPLSTFQDLNFVPAWGSKFHPIKLTFSVFSRKSALQSFERKWHWSALCFRHNSFWGNCGRASTSPRVSAEPSRPSLGWRAGGDGRRTVRATQPYSS